MELGWENGCSRSSWFAVHALIMARRYTSWATGVCCPQCCLDKRTVPVAQLGGSFQAVFMPAAHSCVVQSNSEGVQGTTTAEYLKTETMPRHTAMAACSWST
eukprot:343393-Rhodomonas_salina.1